jgi:nicotinate-nucleotide adenylyltransferase
MGILGGTFNPPHVGHLALARHARVQLGLQTVVLVPANRSPFKPDARDPGPEHRLAMCRALVRDTNGVGVCARELDRGGISYTVDTLSELHAAHPNDSLTLIVGADTACTLPRWREPQTLLELARLAVAERRGTTREQVLDSVRAIDPDAEASFLTLPPIDVSSSECRRLAAAGEPIARLTGEGVAAYVAEHGLYREGARARA